MLDNWILTIIINKLYNTLMVTAAVDVADATAAWFKISENKNGIYSSKIDTNLSSLVDLPCIVILQYSLFCVGIGFAATPAFISRSTRILSINLG